MNSLYAQGKISGNAGDTYENRDGLHVNFCEGWTPNPDCPLAYRLFPQHAWLLSGSAGKATGVHSGVTVGQASYSGETSGGVKHSIPYVFYKTQSGADILYNQYTHNNLYIYPSLAESTGDNIGNTSYVISSEDIAKAGTDYYHAHDSSGSDLPFVKIALATLASFRPEVKRSLISGTNIDGKRVSFLMPTLQMLIRHAHRSVSTESDYLGSVAHDNTSRANYMAGGLPQPSYDSAKLVRLGSELTLSEVPPLVRLKVLAENFTDSEKLFNTPGAIARSVSVGTALRSITISAEDSIDLDGTKSNHMYEWRVLHGDANKIKITKDQSVPGRAVIEFTGGDIWKRLDVGVFVKKQNGKYYSVPGIVSVYVR